MPTKKSDFKIAVIGAGIFGSTVAIKLAKQGAKVTLFDKAKDIMTAASAINQYRLHRGYHYPRSGDTINSCVKATPQFEVEYKEAIISHLEHFYSIAKKDSLIDADTYISILNKHNLPFEIVEPTHINKDFVQITIKAEENLYDPKLLKELVLNRLKNEKVTLILNQQVDVDDLVDYDYVIVATYADSNSVFKQKQQYCREYQFELCEKIVIEIPDELKGLSTVIMDGPFMSFDPYGDTGYAVMGHVEHAIHKRSFGFYPEIPSEFLPYLNNGVIKNPSISSASDFLKEAIDYMPALARAKHIGSMFTVRTVLPRVDVTDARPTIINDLDGRIITVYSGKVGNCVMAGNEVVDLIYANKSA